MSRSPYWRQSLAGPLPGQPRLLAEHAVVFQGAGITHVAHRGVGEEDQGSDPLAAHARRLDQLLRVAVLLLAHKPVVAKVRGAVAVVVGVFLEEAAEELLLVGPADLVGDEPADVPQQPRLAVVVAHAVLEEADAANHPEVLVVVVVEGGGDVVGQVPSLVSPGADEVGLDLGDLLQGGGEVGPVLLLLALVGLIPEDVRRRCPASPRCRG